MGASRDSGCFPTKHLSFSDTAVQCSLKFIVISENSKRKFLPPLMGGFAKDDKNNTIPLENIENLHPSH
uniref:Uncharacterized protein n=1 Tax=Glycine max TaxID=3847 RepID=C6T2P8_SOYBN|nr:unknown [Glycine max]